MATIRGVVLESREKEALVLTTGGEFKKIRTKKLLESGEEIEISEWRRELWLYTVATVIMFMITWLVVSFLSVCAYVTVHTNPGVSMGVNSRARIVTIKALDAEGQALINKRIKGKKVEQAVEDVLTWSFKQGHNNTGAEVLITVEPLSRQGNQLKPTLVNRLESAADRTVLLQGRGRVTVKAYELSQ